MLFTFTREARHGPRGQSSTKSESRPGSRSCAWLHRLVAGRPPGPRLHSRERTQNGMLVIGTAATGSAEPLAVEDGTHARQNGPHAPQARDQVATGGATTALERQPRLRRIPHRNPARLEDEQREFKEFLERLRFAKDRSEFDQFMAERRNRPPTRVRRARSRPDRRSRFRVSIASFAATLLPGRPSRATRGLCLVRRSRLALFALTAR